MERLSDDEFWAGQSPASRAHLPLVTSPLSSPLDTPSLRRVLELPVNRPDTGIEIEETNSNDDQVIEEEEQEVVRSLGGVSSRLQYKMAAVMEELRTQRMGVGTFIRAWIEQDDIMRTRRMRLIRKLVSQDPVLREAFGIDDDTLTGGPFEDLVTHELDGLTSQPFFNQFQEEDRVESIRYAGAHEKLESSAPTWCGFLMRILQNARAHRESYAERKDLTLIQQKAYLLTSVICRARARKNSNYLAKTLGLYMVSSGVKRRVIEVLAGLGICDTYKYLYGLYERIANKGEASTSRLSKNDTLRLN
jgi:hypothetical protein